MAVGKYPLSKAAVLFSSRNRVRGPSALAGFALKCSGQDIQSGIANEMLDTIIRKKSPVALSVGNVLNVATKQLDGASPHSHRRGGSAVLFAREAERTRRVGRCGVLRVTLSDCMKSYAVPSLQICCRTVRKNKALPRRHLKLQQDASTSLVHPLVQPGPAQSKILQVSQMN